MPKKHTSVVACVAVVGLAAVLLSAATLADVTAEMQRGASVDSAADETQGANSLIPVPAISENSNSDQNELEPNLYRGRAFPGQPITGQYLKTQQLFDNYYAGQRYQEAYDVLLKGLVWRGDKHAQYMLGIMYWHGQGVAQNKIKGAAWFRLSAQRGNTLLMKLRDEAWMQLTPEQKAEAAAHFEEIRDEYGDRVVIKKLLRQDNWKFNKSIARHPTARGGNIDIIDGSGLTGSGIDAANQLEARVQKRLEYLGGYVEYGELEMIDDATTAANQENTE